jgi:hypothetical protein
MADVFYFSRDTKVYIVQSQTTTGTARWEIPVLDGFSFSQGTNTSEITLNEMAAASGNKSRRSRQMFTDSFAPGEWSFSTYMRPFLSGTAGVTNWEDTTAAIHAVEEVLWANFIAKNTHEDSTSGSSSWADGVTYTSSGSPAAPESVDFDFTGSEVAELGTFDIYFEMGGAGGGTKTVYKLEGAVVNSATIDFEIDGIATINWSGMCKVISEAETGSVPSATRNYNEGVSATNNFIRNRLTTLAVTNADGGPYAATYDLTLTGGSITFENNMSFLTPETLGVVNTPLGHVTGTRSVSGNFTCYLDGGTSGGSADLFEDLIEDTSTITNDFNMVFSIGGATAPKVEITLPNCHLEVPTHSIDDIISIDTNFHALPASIDPANTAGNYEAEIKYFGVALPS